jgi:hypothetical protein
MSEVRVVRKRVRVRSARERMGKVGRERCEVLRVTGRKGGLWGRVVGRM